MTNSITPIAHILTPFTQKFSIPRQGLALSSAKGEIVFSEHIDIAQSLDGIDEFSHLWLLFLFHENLAQGYKPKVRPPRLGGNKKIGVFASRSSFRPNGIGMSVVKNLGLHNNKLLVEGVDLLSHTPILDIKPYLPYADAIPQATAGYAQEKPAAPMLLSYSSTASKKLAHYKIQYPDLESLIHNLLSQDPRPSYKQNKVDEKIYYVQLYAIEISWSVTGNTVYLIDIYPIIE